MDELGNTVRDRDMSQNVTVYLHLYNIYRDKRNGLSRTWCW